MRNFKINKNVLRHTIIFILALILCFVSLVPAAAKSTEEISENEFDARMLFTKYATAMTAFSGRYGVEGLNNLDFNGAITETNADRILTTAVYLEYASKEDGLDFIQNSNGNFAFTTEEAKELVQKYYTIPKTNFKLSTFYNRALRKVIITERDVVNDFTMPTIYINQDTFSFEVDDTGSGVVFATLKGWIITGNNGGAGYLEIVLQVPGTDLSKAHFGNTVIASVSVVDTIPPLKFAPNDSYRKMDAGYYRYMAPETAVADMLNMISVDSVKSKLTVYDADGNEKTEGIIGTGDYVVDGDNPDSPWNYLVLVVENDISGDGKISTADFLQIQSHFNGEHKITDQAKFLAADFIRDGRISANDYMKAKQIYLEN